MPRSSWSRDGSLAFTDGGRTGLVSESYDAALNVSGYAVEGFADADASQLRLSDLLAHLPVAVLKARYHGAAKPARKRGRGHQLFLVSSSLPRFWIAACATSAKRCSSHGSTTSTRT